MNNQLYHLYEPFTLVFRAHVEQVTPLAGGKYSAILERTYFYPTGGGQEHDTGFIGEARVLDVIKPEQEGQPTQHVLDRSLTPGEYPSHIDEERRMRHMQHHTAQHLLSQCFIRLFGFETVSANINGYSPSTIDLKLNSIEQSQLIAAQVLANTTVFENRLVKTYFWDAADISSIPLRRPPKVEDHIRIVEIDGFDYSACGGTHCQSTGQIGSVFILKAERQNNKMRVYFVAGTQAAEYFGSYQQTLNELTSLLHTSIADLPQSAGKLIEQQAQTKKQLAEFRLEKIGQQAKQLYEQADRFGAARVVRAGYKGWTPSEVRTLGEELRQYPDVIGMLASYDGQRVSMVVVCTLHARADANALLNRQLARIGGKGGGDNQIAQGGGPATSSQFEAIFDQSDEMIREQLEGSSAGEV